MRKCIVFLLTAWMLIMPVSAMEFTAPEAPLGAQEYMPDVINSFGDGLWYVIKTAASKLRPDFAEAQKICLYLITAVILISVVESFDGKTKLIASLTSTIVISTLLLEPANALVQLGAQTVRSISEYGKLLLPVMTAAMAAQGYTSTSAALYVSTALFDAILSKIIASLIVPMLYLYLSLAIAASAIGEELLLKLKKLIKWAMTWSLKIVLYVFTGYISITGVVSGSADATAVKAAKLAISSAVPVVGGLISDASETIVVSAGFMKNSVGVFGLLAVVATCISPFLQIGIQYVLLKLTAGVCNILGTKNASQLIEDFSIVMGHLLAMTGTVCLLLLISTVCFMKGVS